MSTKSTSTATSTRVAELPSVNLLPPEIFEKRQIARAQLGLGLVVLVAIVGVGYVYVSGGSAVTDAKSRLQTSQATQNQLQTQLSQLSYVTADKAQAEAAQAILTKATASEISFSSYLSDLSLLTPKNVWYSSITLTNAVPPASLASAAQAPAIVGSVSIAGQALSHNDVATWLDNATKEVGFADPYFSASTETAIPNTGTRIGTAPQTWITFAGSVNLTPAALLGAESGN